MQNLPLDYEVIVTPVGPLQMNSVLVINRSQPEDPVAALIDPGDEPERLIALVEGSGCRLEYLLATHGHFDHVGAASAVAEHFKVTLRCHQGDVPLIQEMGNIQAAYGFAPTPIPQVEPTLEHDGLLPFPGEPIRITHVPGHSPGQLMFTLGNHALVGDCLFAGSVGRTDLPGGDFDTLEKSIRESIYTLADETIVVCGHGPDTTVGREKTSNPFVRG